MDNPQPANAPSLRERKKAKVFNLIRTNALRLFAAKGFENTTVEEIAAASDISPSTFFRYFPTKEDVALYDALDAPLIAAFKSQPASIKPLQAMRNALSAAFAPLSKEDLQLLQQQQELILKTPALRGKMLEELVRNVDLMTQLLADRTGARPDDVRVRTFAGAFIGVNMAAIARFMRSSQPRFEDYQKDLAALLDEFEQNYRDRFPGAKS